MLGNQASLIPWVGVSAVSSPLEVGAGRAAEAARELSAALVGAGCEVVEVPPLGSAEEAAAAGRHFATEQVDAVALVAASWFEDYLGLDLLEECSAPLLLWALPGMETGALCGTQQLTCFLREWGRSYEAVYGPPDSPECLARARAFLRAAALRRRLRRARVGLAGHRVSGMTHTAPAEFALKAALGPRVVPLDLPRLLERAGQVSEAETRAAWETLQSRAGQCRVADQEGLTALGLHVALREAAHEQGLDALTVGCYPDLMGRPCLAAALLAEEGLPLACEGDVNGAVGQLMLALLTGQPTHHTDWLEPLADGSVVFTHCGSGAFSLAENPGAITLGPVRLKGQGVCALFPAKPGPVTLVNLSAHADGYQCAVLEGEALSTEMVFPGNPLRVRFAAPTGVVVDWIFREGLAHHWAAGYGHVAEELRQWARLCGPRLRLVTGPADGGAGD